jgi:hypothetical protein
MAPNEGHGLVNPHDILKRRHSGKPGLSKIT